MYKRTENVNKKHVSGYLKYTFFDCQNQFCEENENVVLFLVL